MKINLNSKTNTIIITLLVRNKAPDFNEVNNNTDGDDEDNDDDDVAKSFITADSSFFVTRKW